MAKQAKSRSIKTFFQFVIIFPIIYIVILLVGVTVLSFFYAKTDNLVLFFIMIGFAIFMIGYYAFYLVYLNKQFKEVFINGLYDVTVHNLENISRNNNNFREYPSNQYDEVMELNEHIDTLRKELNGATLITGESDFSNIALGYLDKERTMISYASFKRELDNIIFVSQNFRNVIVELYYDLGDSTLSEKNIVYLLKVLKENFADYKNTLYIVADDRKSIYIYLPRIDTLSKVKEQLETCMRNTSISRRMPEGITSLSGHFSVVCYPFSDVEELLPDLRYAKRQGGDIFFYLPNRLNTFKNKAILKNTMNLNAMSKITAPLLNMKYSLDNLHKNARIVEGVIKEALSYFNLDYAGIISFDEVKKTYSLIYQVNANELPPLSHDGAINNAFIDVMDKAKDENNSYYFAFRNHANNALGRHLDRIGIESGFYYVVRDSENVIAVIYFFNKNREFKIDSYIQESLVMLCHKIADWIVSERRDREVESSYLEIDSILKLSDYSTYRVSKENYDLLRMSTTIKDFFPEAKVGEKCYKTLYGLDHPCPDCPLITGQKKETRFGRDNFETSLILSERNLPYQVMTVKNLYTHKSHSRYHQDLIINSYHSLIENLENSYEINGKGYILLLRIDNLAELIKEKGSENYLSIIRDFTQRLKKVHNGLENIYYFNNQFLALLYTEYGQTDIIDECEKIYNVAQDKKGEVEYKLAITFLPVSYPRVYPNAASLIKQADAFATRGKYGVNKNFIYFDESNYSRSADREQFLLTVIENAFGNKTYDINLQPMVSADDKQIYGAELLLRIVDEYRNTTFRADELINVAAAHDKIGIISHALLNFIGSLYEQYGNNLFANLGFKRLSLNTDYSFFTDKNFRSDTKKFIDQYKIPKNFLTFEIPESDVANHIEEFKSISKDLRDLRIILVCDQYTGRFISVDNLSQIGFNEVKISRNVVNHIDSDEQRYNNLKQLLNLIRGFGMKASIVGVENIDQYNLIKACDDTALLQGFYFYRPLEKQSMIEVLRSVNRFSKKDEPEATLENK